MPTTRKWEIQSSMFGTPVDYFFPTFKGSKLKLSKQKLELWRVKLYRNGLRGNKNCFELAGGSSYRG